MKLIHQIQSLRRLDALIRRKQTGNARALAEKFGVSPATIYRWMEDLKDLGAEISWCRFRQSYYYNQEFSLIL
ncbi:MAG TPA: helix-turn-helix domain-containing protein [Flavilitoribacter sp.]|nr:helix-turn-helix domain-containing protein [Flavilitoribacter sp.]